jgi:hypothetical protein
MSHEVELGTLLLGAVTSLLAVAQSAISLSAYVTRRQVPSLAFDDAARDADGDVNDFSPFSLTSWLSPGVWRIYGDARHDRTYGALLWRKALALCGSGLLALIAGFAWGELLARNSAISLPGVHDHTSGASNGFLVFVIACLVVQLLHVVSQPRKAYTIEIRGLQPTLFCLAFVIAFIQFIESAP